MDNTLINAIHSDVVAKVQSSMPTDEELIELSELYKVFGDSTRIKILSALSYAEMCVSDIAVLSKMSESAISHQLRLLRQAKLVKQRRQGKVVYYSLLDTHVEAIMAQGLEHINE